MRKPRYTFSLSKRNDLQFPDTLMSISGEKIKINPGHKTILKIYRLIADEGIAEHHRIAKACDLFFADPYGDIEAGFLLLLAFIANQEINEDENGEGKTGSHNRYIDYEEDAAEIYASFLQLYGIDLIDTDIHWYRFTALLSAMLRVDDTPFSAKVHLRTLDTSNMKGKAKAKAEEAKRSVQLEVKVSEFDKVMEERILEAINSGISLKDILEQ